MLLDIFFGLLGCIFFFLVAYLFFLAIVALWPGGRSDIRGAKVKFLLVIPAHNEAQALEQTLDKISRLDYPKELMDVVVLADNCDDNTVEVARRFRVTCLEKRDGGIKGKGELLRWAIPRLLSLGDHQVFVIIDADTHPAPDFLEVLNNHFSMGAEVVQTYTQVRHPERSVLESLAFLGFALNRNLRYQGRSRLGWQSNITGSGLCIARRVLERYGWPTTTMVEDIEYEMFLKLRGVRVVFAQDAKATVEIHSRLQETKGQRLRWDLGKFQVRNRFVPALFKAFMKTRDLSYLDCIMELILPPFSLFVLLTTGLFLLYLLVGFHGANWVFYVWLAVILGLLTYIIIGLISAKATIKVYMKLLYAPFFVLWRAWILFVESLFGRKGNCW